MGRLTHRQIAEIVGDIDDVKAAAIIATGANVKQLEEAVVWASGVSRLGEELERPLSGVVAEIYQILTSDEEYGDERD